ncbi:hypothetical protein [Burkholderia territorii]|uniref:hypothetical protein n=1 Tax=Burkholderia territorii TaxID=1503055 RepID=UPI0012DA75D2|nr:hypothetical protein [Burkholderia territorii]
MNAAIVGRQNKNESIDVRIESISFILPRIQRSRSKEMVFGKKCGNAPARTIGTQSHRKKITHKNQRAIRAS